MVFNSYLIIGLLVLLILGFCALTYIVWKLQSHYNRLTGGENSITLSQVLNSLLTEGKRLRNRVTSIEEEVRRLKTEGTGHIQRIGVVRFNPFSDTGGAQSFTIAILDGNQNGIVMTSLYGRSGNRWYVKQIDRGKGKNIELSKEEASAILQAL